MTMKAEAIVNRAAVLLHDSTNVRWPVVQLLDYLNDGQREVTMLRPDASMVTGNITLVTGNTKQSIPTDGIRLFSVIRNTSGRPIIVIDRDILDSQIPDWHTATGGSEVKHFVFDPKNPKIFYVYPKPATTISVEASYSVAPDELDSVSDYLEISDIYANSLLDYVLYRAFSKDTEYADLSKADRHYETFVRALGFKTDVDMSIDPNADGPANGRA